MLLAIGKRVNKLYIVGFGGVSIFISAYTDFVVIDNILVLGEFVLVPCLPAQPRSTPAFRAKPNWGEPGKCKVIYFTFGSQG